MIAVLRRKGKAFLVARTSAAQRRRLKRIARSARGPLRRARRRLRGELTADRLAADLRAGGLEPGDVVVVHSALSRSGNVHGGAATVVESLMDAVTPEGTIVMPTFGDAETVLERMRQGRLVDLRTEPSGTGKVTEVFRTRPGVRRSSHPFSSFAAWGRHAEYVTEGHADDARIAHGSSPLGRVVELGGKVVGLGVTLGPVSFYHVLEDTWDGFPFDVYGPEEEVTYVDPDGRTVTRRIRRYDPNVRRTRIDQPEGEWIRDRLTEHFRRRGILREFRYGAGPAWAMDARALYDELRRLAEKGVTMYLTEEASRARGEPVEAW